jgi:hypothetical protein
MRPPDEDALREAFVEAWRDDAHPTQPHQEFEVGKTLGALQQAIIYQRIMRGLELVGRNVCAYPLLHGYGFAF